MKLKFTKKQTLLVIIVLLLFGGGAVAVFLGKAEDIPIIDKLVPGGDSDAVKAGKQLSNGHCEGEGVPYKLSRSPMDPEDFSHIVPYGAVIGGHVTPIDHQYFSPTVFNSPKDTYPVYAMADSTLVHIETHPTRIRLIFSISCTYFYYYDLVTSLSAGLEQNKLPIDVKAGQVIGRIGGQTLDFAVWDTEKPLKGFITPEFYEAEGWKIYTADPLEYYTDDLKALIQTKYVRVVEPVSGKIDHDIDGKLIGNWFLEGTGYGGPIGRGTQNPDYFEGHLSVVPDVYDPTAFIISVGYLEGPNRPNQFSVPRNSVSPADAVPDTGIVKYELKGWSYRKSDGSFWDRMSFTKGVTLDNSDGESSGCAIAQLIEKRKLKFETFLGKSCTEVSGFTSAARVYGR